jgi:predicted RNA binding protein YcfA (HicA-like mRNA interferase family)
VKVPRDVSGSVLIRALRKFGYQVIRQRGSHLIVQTLRGGQQTLVIPNHTPILVGTLHDILKEVAQHAGKTVEEIIVDLRL